MARHRLTGPQAGDLSIEVALLLGVGGHPGCGSVRLERGSRVASPHEEVAADSVEAAIGVDPRVGTETLDQLGAGPGSGDHADGDGVGEREDRVVQAEWEVVEVGDLEPLGRFGALRLIVEGGDSCLELVRPDGAADKGGGDQCDPLLGGSAIPQAAFLLGHGDERPVGPGFHTGHDPRSAALALPGALPVLALTGAVVSTAPPICQNIALRGWADSTGQRNTGWVPGL
jgi:hypothetical protein